MFSLSAVVITSRQANRRWALEVWLEAVRKNPDMAKGREEEIAEAEAELSVAKDDDTKKVVQNRNT
jgi:hypothetical protein